MRLIELCRTIVTWCLNETSLLKVLIAGIKLLTEIVTRDLNDWIYVPQYKNVLPIWIELIVRLSIKTKEWNMVWESIIIKI